MNGNVLHCPPDLHVLIEHQVWARVQGGEATVGITALGIHQAGEIYMCRPKSVGQLVQQGRAVAVVELAKSIVSVKSPASGEVLEINPLLERQPEWVHRDPYGQGWLARLRLSAWPQEADALVHGPALAAAMARHAWLEGLAPAPPGEG